MSSLAGRDMLGGALLANKRSVYRLVNTTGSDAEEVTEYDDAYAAFAELQRLVWKGAAAAASLRLEGPAGQLVADATDVL